MSDTITVAIEMPRDNCSNYYYLTGEPRGGCPNVPPTRNENASESPIPCDSDYWAFLDDIDIPGPGYFCAGTGIVSNYAISTGLIPTISNQFPISMTFPYSPNGGGANGGCPGGGHNTPRGFMVMDYNTSTLDLDDINLLLSETGPPYVNKNINDAYYTLNITSNCGTTGTYYDVQRIPSIVDQLNTNILPSFCFQEVTGGCPGGTGSTGCARIVSTANGSQLCQEWALGNQNGKSFRGAALDSNLVDTYMENYCESNPTRPECQCLSRNEPGAIGHEDYEVLAQAANAGERDWCWYIPCKQIGNVGTLLTSDFVNPTQTCPTTICENILEFINNNASNINIGQYKALTSCTSGGGNGGETLWQKIWSHKWLFSGLLLLFTIIIIVIVFLAHRHGKEV